MALDGLMESTLAPFISNLLSNRQHFSVRVDRPVLVFLVQNNWPLQRVGVFMHPSAPSQKAIPLLLPIGRPLMVAQQWDTHARLRLMVAGRWGASFIFLSKSFSSVFFCLSSIWIYSQYCSPSLAQHAVLGPNLRSSGPKLLPK